MNQRLRDLIGYDRGVTSASNAHADQIAMEVFGNARSKPFVPTPPTSRATLQEPRLSMFDTLGENEQRLVYKLLHGTFATIHLTGGIGVGKTRFLHYFVEDILPKLQHKADGLNGRCPMVFYVDCNDYAGVPASVSEKPEEIIISLTRFLLDAICTKLTRWYTIQDEVGTIWDTLIKSDAKSLRRNPAIIRLEALLHENSLLEVSPGTSEKDLIAQRRVIRKELTADPDMRAFYVAALLNYVSEQFFKDHAECMLIIVDNIDLHGVLVQSCAKRILQPLFDLSRVRIVMALRYTTERQTFSVQTQSSYTIDSIEYKGADPIRIIRSRIEFACAHEDEVLGFVALEPRERVVSFLRRLNEHHLAKPRDVITLLLQGLIGESARKGLIYAESLVNNSVYDPCSRTPSAISDGEILRAIMVGSSTTFREGDGQTTCNLFQVPGPGASACFLKLRALRAVAVQRDMRVKELQSFLQLFGYPDTKILDGINELISASKRLLWSDAVQRFGTASDLVTHGESRLNLSQAGQAYQEYLYRRIEYIQEVMLDTYVPETLAGPGWKLNQIEDRFGLVATFLEHLIDTELDEVSRLARPNELHRRFSGQEEFFSERMCSAVLESANRILGPSARTGNLAVFLSEYEERLRVFIDRLRDARVFPDEPK